MSFTVQLGQDLVPVEAGVNTPFTISLTNKGTEREDIELEIEGIDPEWKAIPVPVVSVEPGETHSEKVFFRPSRASESAAGNYPFVVQARSLKTGEQKTSQGVLQLKAFHHLSLEVMPRKGSYSVLRKNNSFDLTVVNLGNSEHTVQLLGNDPEDACAYDFEQNQVVVGPGQQKEVEFLVTPTKSRVFSSSRLIGFTVTGRSVQSPNLATSAQGQLEVRSPLSPTNVTVGAILLFIFTLWLMMMPKPPGIEMSINPMTATVGDQVVVSWKAHDATRVIVQAGQTPVYDGQLETGSVQFKLDSEEMGTISAVASRDGQRSPAQIKHLTLRTLVKAGAPSVLKFSTDTKQVKLGTPFVINYKFNPDTVRAKLAPLDKDLDINLDQIEVTPTSIGQKEYSVIAYNKDNEPSKPMTIKVEVVDPSDATIDTFDVNPLIVKVDDMRTTLNWNVFNATTVKLQVGSAPAEIVEANVSNRVITIGGKTTFILTALDSKGRKAVKQITVDVEKTPLVNPEGHPTDPPTSHPGDVR